MIVCNKHANEGKIVEGVPGLNLQGTVNWGGVNFDVRPQISSPKDKHFCQSCLLEALASFDFNALVKSACEQEKKLDSEGKKDGSAE